MNNDKADLECLRIGHERLRQADRLEYLCQPSAPVQQEIDA